MQITDRLYGEFTITEPLLTELMEAPTVQRLKRLSQAGLPERLYPEFPPFTRYEHSVGVMLLLRKLGAPLIEQAAGLLHDVSHTAFSHVVDWVLDRADEDFQDSRHLAYLKASEIPVILARHDVALSEVAEYEHHSLLEQPAPALCADRVDYALREMLDWADPDSVPTCVASLANHNGTIVFTNTEAAERFARAYMKCQREHWGEVDSMLRYEILAEAIRICLAEGTVTVADLDGDDESALVHLYQSASERVRSLLSKLEGRLSAEEKQRYVDTTSRKKKFRYIDPSILVGTTPVVLSTVNVSYQQLLNNYLQAN